MAGGDKSIPISDGSFDETFPQISPDGRLLAYMSNETGRYEIYVQELKATDDSVIMGSKLLISQGGGFYPMWRADGKQIVYLGGNRTTAMSAAIDANHSLQAGSTQALFDATTDRGGTLILAPTADQKRFLIPVAEGSKTPQSFTVIVNWASALQSK
jgi:Tol biopolymer transport system component